MQNRLHRVVTVVVVHLVACRPSTNRASQPEQPAPVEAPELVRFQPPVVPSLPVELGPDGALCIGQPGAERCSFRPDRAGLPVAGVQDTAVGPGIACALQPDAVSCWNVWDPAASAPVLKVDAPGATRIEVGSDILCAASDTSLSCWSLHSERDATGVRGHQTLQFSPRDFDILNDTVYVVTPQGQVAPYAFDSSGQSLDPQPHLPIEDARRIAVAGVERVTVATMSGKVIQYRRQTRNYDAKGPTVVQGLPEAIDVASAWENSCAATTDGVWCWGSNGDDAIGLFPTPPSGEVSPTRIPLEIDAFAIDAGGATYCAGTEQHVRCWGGRNLALSHLYRSSELVIESGSAGLEVRGPNVCSKDQEGARRCYGSTFEPPVGNRSNRASAELGWTPKFPEVEEHSEDCLKFLGGKLVCGGSTLSSEVSTFAERGGVGCFVSPEGGLSCFWPGQPSASVQNASGVRDVAVFGSSTKHVCTLDQSERISCTRIPEKPKLRPVENSPFERFTWRPNRKPTVLATVSGATELVASEGLLCVRTEQGAVECWDRVDRPQRGVTLPTTATSIVMSNRGGCVTSPAGDALCFSDAQATDPKPVPVSEPVVEIVVGIRRPLQRARPLCTRSGTGRVRCTGLSMPPMIWPPREPTLPPPDPERG